MELIHIENISCPEAAPYAELTGAQLRHAGEGRGLFIAESLLVAAAAAEAGYRPVSFLAEEEKFRRIEEAFPDLDAPVYTARPEALERLTGFRLSRGVLCAMERIPLPSPEEVLKCASRIAVLEGITDPTNVGAIFRSAAALGMDAVLVGSSCCEPLHRRAARVSMGAVFRIPWAVLGAAGDGIGTDVGFLRERGFTTAAAALSPDAIPVTDPALRNATRLAVLLGSEGNGLAKETIAACDMTVTIPMAHGVDSLNVAAASAVLFWETGKSRKA
ncbi:MAG: RNA methyltransferase [Clostridia bacterium]|nr:RNA methyltransferase [Clostridia bacterium]